MADVREKSRSDDVPDAVASKGNLAPREIEVLPQYQVEQKDVDYKQLLAQFRDMAVFVDGVRKEGLLRTKAHHWLARKQKNGTVTYSLMGPGAERIKSMTPIGFQNKRQWEESWNRESGPGYTVFFEAEFYLGSPRTGLLPAIGSCSSDDQFFATHHAELQYSEENPEHKLALDTGEGRLSADKKIIYMTQLIPAAEVSKENIVKSALTNLIVNGVTRLLGIRSIGEDELKDVGIDIAKIPGFEYGSARAASGKLAPAEEQKREEIKKMLIEMSGGDETKALAELKRLTAFNDYQGCPAWDRITEKQLARKHPEIKAAYDKFREGELEKGDKSQQGAAKGGRTTGAKPADSSPASGGQKPLL